MATPNAAWTLVEECETLLAGVVPAH
jgi:hypothetical protein